MRIHHQIQNIRKVVHQGTHNLESSTGSPVMLLDKYSCSENQTIQANSVVNSGYDELWVLSFRNEIPKPLSLQTYALRAFHSVLLGWHTPENRAIISVTFAVTSPRNPFIVLLTLRLTNTASLPARPEQMHTIGVVLLSETGTKFHKVGL